MEYKLCGDVAILLLSSAERIAGDVRVKIDAPDGTVVTVYRLSDNNVRYCDVVGQEFEIPSDFLTEDRYSVRVVCENKIISGSSFCVKCDRTEGKRIIIKLTESTASEISDMWKVIASICALCEKNALIANEAADAVAKFEKGYRTE